MNCSMTFSGKSSYVASGKLPERGCFAIIDHLYYTAVAEHPVHDKNNDKNHKD